MSSHYHGSSHLLHYFQNHIQTILFHHQLERIFLIHLLSFVSDSIKDSLNVKEEDTVESDTDSDQNAKTDKVKAELSDAENK